MTKYKFFTREAGFSEGLLNSLNFNPSRDDPINLKKNTGVIAEFFGVNPSEIKRVTQKHTSKVVLVESPSLSTASIEADALVTKIPNVVIAVITADCVPVLLYDSENSIIAAIHAGWRGAFSDIIKNTVNEMLKVGGSPNSIKAFIGPSIKQESYEVDEVFYQNFISVDQENYKFFIPSINPNHYMFNLPEFVKNKLISSGVEQININPNDTYSNEKEYFSCRRATHRKEAYFGCQISAIMLEE